MAIPQIGVRLYLFIYYFKHDGLIQETKKNVNLQSICDVEFQPIQ